MRGITHEQAIQWINRRLDGLLSESQLLELDEHLRSCDSCRAYAAELSSLPAHLQEEFRARWDHQLGPSQNITELVTAKARRIPMRRRFSSGIKLLASAATLIMLGFLINLVVSQLQSTSTSASETEMAISSALAANRLIAFTSDQNGNYDIAIVHADGSGLTNLTNHPAKDVNPIWSPDGKHIAFESDRDGFMQIYRMDTDGSNVVQLTRDEADHKLPLQYDGKYNPWSPDGNRLIFIQKESGGETEIPGEMGTLYSIAMNGEKEITLANGRVSNVSWSPDGRYIGYILNVSTTPNETYVPNLFVVEPDGSNVRELKTLLPPLVSTFGLYYWSSNGQSIVFSTFEDDPLRQTIYELDLQTNAFLSETETKPIVVAWSEDVSLISDVNQEGAPLVWERSDGTSNTFEESKAWGEPCSMDLTRSPQNNFAFGVYCPYNKFNLYWTNSDGSNIKQLLTLPIDLVTGGVGDIAWSPDDRYIAFTIESPGKTDMYILNVEEARANPSVQPVQMSVSNSELYGIPSWQPVTSHELAEENPTPAPTQDLSSDNLIAFASDQSGDLEIYTMRADGSGMTNLTEHPAQDSNPIWSPDGQHIAFESDRDGSNQIYLMDAHGSNILQLTHDAADHFLPMSIHDETNPWSPDGSKLLFLQRESEAETSTLYSLDINGGNVVMLATGHVQFNNLSWSPDGKYAGYVLNDSPTPDATFVTGMYVVDAAGSNTIAINNFLPPGDVVDKPSYSWSGDGSSITFIAYRNLEGATDQWIAYEAVLDSQQLIERATSSTIMESWWAGTSLVSNYEAGVYSLTWLRPDGTSTNFKPLEVCDLTVEADYGFLMRRSSHGNQVINVYCPNKDMWFYYASSDGTIIKPLVNSPILSINVYHSITNMNWSSDDQFIAVTLVSPTKSSLYILNVNDTSIQPQEIIISSGELYTTPSWQPTP